MNRTGLPTHLHPLYSLFTAIICVTLWLLMPTAEAQRYSFTREWPNTDFTNAVIDLAEVRSGGVPKDGIPAIDDPKFVSIQAAKSWLTLREPVIVLDILGQAKAYPLQILIWHEIVNDELNGNYIAVTFCPLCNASIVFNRNLDGEIVNFGTTGNLRNSDLIMYDRQTESWWQQITGRGIVGFYADVELDILPSQITSFAQFADAYPDGLVLSQETGFRRSYGENPYRGYDNINNVPFLLSDPADPRLPAMERVINVSVNDRHRVYPFSAFVDEPVINDRFNGVPIVIFSMDDATSALDARQIADSRVIASATAYRRQLGEFLLDFEKRDDGNFYDVQTGSEWNLFGQATAGPLQGEELIDAASGVHFAFAWLVFHPASEIYDRK